MYTTRKAFGPHGYRKPETKARDIAEAMLRHRAKGSSHFTEIADYGLREGSELYGLVEETLEEMQTKQAA